MEFDSLVIKNSKECLIVTMCLYGGHQEVLSTIPFKKKNQYAHIKVVSPVGRGKSFASSMQRVGMRALGPRKQKDREWEQREYHA